MAQEMSDAVKVVKDMDKKLVVAENRLAFVQQENQRLLQTRDALQAEIDKKTADYNIYIAQRDSESKRLRQETLDGQKQLAQEKEEFQGILAQFQKERQSFLAEKESILAEREKIKAQRDNIQGFIIAVQRACSLLGF